MSNIYGIDVSSYNGVIDWGKVGAVCGFAVIKITRKDLTADKRFAANIKGCKAQCIPYSVYRYVYESTPAAAEKAAWAVVGLLRQYDAAPGTIVWWDLEDASIKGAAKTTLTDSIIIAETVIHRAGYSFGIYCNKDWYNNVLQTAKLDCAYWIAAYGTNPTMEFGKAPGRAAPQIKHTLWGWQYCSKGKVPGISGSVDLNAVYGMSATGCPVPTRILRKGCKGDDVKWLQERLNVCSAGLKVDGDFGPVTEAAVREYQLRHGLAVDGIVGPVTRKALGA